MEWATRRASAKVVGEAPAPPPEKRGELVKLAAAGLIEAVRQFAAEAAA